jgi:large subunit ribosomal protein L35
MPKIKPHKGAQKRFRVTRNGKVVKVSAYTGHIKAKKSAKRKRRLRRVTEVSGPDARRIKRLLGMR